MKSEIEVQAESMLKIGSAVDETTVGAQQVSERINQVNDTAEKLVREADEIEESYAGVTAQLLALKEKSSNFLAQINS